MANEKYLGITNEKYVVQLSPCEEDIINFIKGDFGRLRNMRLALMRSYEVIREGEPTEEDIEDLYYIGMLLAKINELLEEYDQNEE